MKQVVLYLQFKGSVVEDVVYEDGTSFNPEEYMKGNRTTTFYVKESITPYATFFAAYPQKILSKGTALRIGKLKIISLISWRMPDFSNEKVLKILEEFKNREGEIPSSTGIAVAMKLPIHENRAQLHDREAVLMSIDYEDKYLPAYRAGIITNQADHGELYENVVSYDISSAYPASLLEGFYPREDSTKVDNLDGIEVTEDGRIEGLEKGSGFIARCTLVVERRENVQLSPLENTDQQHYYSKDTVFDKVGIVTGKVRIALTLPELLAIGMTYRIKRAAIHELFVHQLGLLPESVRTLVHKLYDDKKQDEAAKIIINTLAGLAGRSPIRDIGKPEEEITPEMIRKQVAIYNGENKKTARTMGFRRKFDQRTAAYMVSWNRLKMVAAARVVTRNTKAKMIYADTDSIKFVGDAERVGKVFAHLNKKVIEDVGDSGIGQWGDESDEFKQARFFGKRFYVKNGSKGLVPVLAGTDIEYNQHHLEKIGMSDINSETIVAQSRWDVTEDGKPEVISLLFKIGTSTEDESR